RLLRAPRRDLRDLPGRQGLQARSDRGSSVRIAWHARRNSNISRRVSLHVQRNILTSLLAVLSVCIAATVSAETMPLSQIHKGMRGYGLTVFEGTKLAKFDVEVVGVLNNIGPSQNLILIKVDAPEVQRAGVIAGMSGSPVFIDGKVIGALAYAWQFAKEPVAGITPIEQMLKIAESGGGPAAGLTAARMSAGDFLKAMSNGKTEELFAKMQS